MARLALDVFLTNFSKKYPKMSKYLLKIDLGGVRMDPMDPYGPGWVRMVPEDSLGASWGLLGPWGSKKGGKGVLTPGGGRGPRLGGLPISPSWANRPPISLCGILTYMPLRAAYGICVGEGVK